MRRGASGLQSLSFIQERTGWARGRREKAGEALLAQSLCLRTPELELHAPSDPQAYPKNIRVQKDFSNKPSRQDFW